jgi:thioredoxin-related protein
MKIIRFAVLAAVFAATLSCAAHSVAASGYDPLANPGAALSRALTEAKTSNKKVLIVAGGDWCRWCLILNSFVADNADIKAELDRSFVTVKVYVGDDNTNAQFFSTLPKAKGYPHFWVISKEGRTTHSINTGTLEKGKDSYDKTAFLRFIREVGKS